MPEGVTIESPIMERPDFEHLEMRGQEKIGKLLSVLKPVDKD